MGQEIIVGILFIAAMFFVGRKIYIEFFSQKKKPGCDKCDVEKK